MRVALDAPSRSRGDRAVGFVNVGNELLHEGSLAASILLALAVFARMLSDSESGETPPDRMLAVVPGTSPDSQPLEFNFEHSDRDTVLLTLLEANSVDDIVLVDEFDRTDDFGDAFAPILGTTGLGFDDFSLEIDSIRNEFNAGLRR